ncbi:MAG: hypothetical protein DMF96_29735 [Acidobacteria bacterium]|nr:MAG: hypothetical protein DMF96_29735 [Acidobacteriota bacterium]
MANIKPIGGGQPRPLTNAHKNPARASEYPKWSPKGDLIAFLRAESEQVRGLYLMSPNGEPVRRLTSMTGIGLSWTPDGRSLAFVDRNSSGEPFSIFQISVETGERRRLTTPPRSTFGDTLCAFSPDGRRLAVVRFGSRYESDLYVMTMDAAEKGLERLTVDSEGIEGLDWTPDGQVIVFGTHRGLWKISASPGERPHPVVMAGIDGGARHPSFSRPTAGRPARLVYQWRTRDVNIWRWDAGPDTIRKVPGSTWFEDFPAFSPDGRRLAVVRFGSRYESDLYVMTMDAAEKGLERLTVDSEGIEGLDWTPDGQVIVFGTHRGLWKISASPGERPHPVVMAGIDGGARHPSFSRPTAGRPARLVYQWRTRDVNIWRWDAGPDTIRKVPGSTWFEDFPAISPDGRRIAFASNRTGANEIWIAKSDGSDQKQVTFQNGPVVTSPQWSPDGERLVFSSQVGGNRDIYIINADGSKSARLTWEPSKEEEPSWSRDGRWIYFRSDRTGIGQIWKMPPEGGSAVRVTAGEASQGFESSDGQLLYFVRGMDVPGLWSVPAAGGTETFVVADVRQAFWGIADAGIYFIVSTPQLSPGGPTIRFFAFSSKTVSTLATLSTEPSNLTPGFSVSRDGRTVLWTQAESLQDDLMLIDPWRP